MFCGKCGKQLEDDEIVCPWCGEPTGVEAGEKNYSHQPESRGYSQNTEERSDVNRAPEKPMALLGIDVYKRQVWDTNLIFIIPEEGKRRCVDYKGNELYITDGELDSYLGGGYLTGYEGDQCFLATSDGENIVKPVSYTHLNQGRFPVLYLLWTKSKPVWIRSGNTETC